MGLRTRSCEERVEFLEGLLRSACKSLQSFYPEIMADEVRKWWVPERARLLREREERADVAGIIHEIVTEEAYEDETIAGEFAEAD